MATIGPDPFFVVAVYPRGNLISIAPEVQLANEEREEREERRVTASESHSEC